MEITRLYKGLCDPQRLRILRLLLEGPLCVCHLMEILGSDQVKISKQLRYLKAQGLAEGERVAQWMVYRLAEPRHPLLAPNLQWLEERAGGPLGFARDLRRRAVLLRRLSVKPAACSGRLCRPAGRSRVSSRRAS